MLGCYFALIDDEVEKSKFERIYWKYRNLVFFLSNQILLNEQDAEDATQNTFLQIARNIGHFEEPASLKCKSLVVLVARQRALDLQKSRQRKGTIPLEETSSTDFSASLFEGWEEKENLLEILGRMKERYRDILLLRFYHGYSTQDIAKFLSVREDNVRKLLQRAREQFLSFYESERRRERDFDR